jgi:hypothetical protein
MSRIGITFEEVRTAIVELQGKQRSQQLMRSEKFLERAAKALSLDFYVSGKHNMV